MNINKNYKSQVLECQCNDMLVGDFIYAYDIAILAPTSKPWQRVPYCILSVVSRHIIILIKYCL